MLSWTNYVQPGELNQKIARLSIENQKLLESLVISLLNCKS